MKRIKINSKLIALILFVLIVFLQSCFLDKEYESLDYLTDDSSIVFLVRESSFRHLVSYPRELIDSRTNEILLKTEFQKKHVLISPKQDKLITFYLENENDNEIYYYDIINQTERIIKTEHEIYKLHWIFNDLVAIGESANYDENDIGLPEYINLIIIDLNGKEKFRLDSIKEFVISNDDSKLIYTHNNQEFFSKTFDQEKKIIDVDEEIVLVSFSPDDGIVLFQMERVFPVEDNLNKVMFYDFKNQLFDDLISFKEPSAINYLSFDEFGSAIWKSNDTIVLDSYVGEFEYNKDYEKYIKFIIEKE